MKTTELLKLETLIESKKKSISRGDAGKLKSIPTEIIAFKTIELLDSKVAQAFKDDNNAFIQVTSLACNIGRSVLADREDQRLSEGRTNTIRYRIGIWLMDILVDMKVLKLLTAKNNTEDRVVTVDDEELFIKLTISIPLNLKDEPVDTRPLLERPNEFKSFKHTLGSPLVRKCNRKLRRSFKQRNMPQVFNAINKQMQTGYKINTRMLDFLNKLDISVSSNLSKKNLDDNQKFSLELAASNGLKQANELGSNEFWTMMYYDFRGRLYQSTTHLNYGSSKLCKSLFLISEAKELGEEGLDWLKIHTANSYQWDKLPLVDRIKQVDDHLDEFLVWAEDPIKYLDEIALADDPYSFVGAILELKAALDTENPKEFISGLPIALDMTCSGLQILSLLSRDEKSGALCNLLPETERGDYYLYIADNIQAFRTDPYWFKHREKRRKLVKRSAMTYFYSCGAKTMGKHIWNDFRNEAGFEALTRSLCSELGQEIYDACRELMPGPTELMDKFVELGAAFAEEDRQLTFQMPTGFIFQQDYHKNRTKQMNSTLGGTRIQSRIIIKKYANVWKSKVQTSSSPNVVHAFDAALLSFIVTTAQYNTAVIHDSFASVPGDAANLFKDGRKALVELFSDDHLSGLLGINDVQIGKLNISNCADNQYLMS